MTSNSRRTLLAATIAAALGVFPALLIGLSIRVFCGVGSFTATKILLTVLSAIISYPWMLYVFRKAAVWADGDLHRLHLTCNPPGKDMLIPEGALFRSDSGVLLKSIQIVRVPAGTSDITFLVKRVLPVEKTTPVTVCEEQIT